MPWGVVTQEVLNYNRLMYSRTGGMIHNGGGSSYKSLHFALNTHT